MTSVFEVSQEFKIQDEELKKKFKLIFVSGFYKIFDENENQTCFARKIIFRGVEFVVKFSLLDDYKIIDINFENKLAKSPFAFFSFFKKRQKKINDLVLKQKPSLFDLVLIVEELVKHSPKKSAIPHLTERIERLSANSKNAKFTMFAFLSEKMQLKSSIQFEVSFIDVFKASRQPFDPALSAAKLVFARIDDVFRPSKFITIFRKPELAMSRAAIEGQEGFYNLVACYFIGDFLEKDAKLVDDGNFFFPLAVIRVRV